jgi:hypothetical protein
MSITCPEARRFCKMNLVADFSNKSYIRFAHMSSYFSSLKARFPLPLLQCHRHFSRLKMKPVALTITTWQHPANILSRSWIVAKPTTTCLSRTPVNSHHVFVTRTDFYTGNRPSQQWTYRKHQVEYKQQVLHCCNATPHVELLPEKGLRVTHNTDHATSSRKMTPSPATLLLLSDSQQAPATGCARSSRTAVAAHVCSTSRLHGNPYSVSKYNHVRMYHFSVTHTHFALLIAVYSRKKRTIVRCFGAAGWGGGGDRWPRYCGSECIPP